MIDSQLCQGRDLSLGGTRMSECICVTRMNGTHFLSKYSTASCYRGYGIVFWVNIENTAPYMCHLWMPAYHDPEEQL